MSIYNNLLGTETEEEKKKRLSSPSQVAGEQQKGKQKSSLYSRLSTPTAEPVKVEEKKPSIIEKIKSGVSKVVEAVSTKKKVEEKLKQVPIIEPKIDTTQVDQQRLQKNILDNQINILKSFKTPVAVESKQLTQEEKAKDKIGPELLRLEQKKTSTEKLDWRDKVYDLATDPGKIVPFVKDAKEVPEMFKLLQASDRLRSNKATKEDAKLLNDWLEQQKIDTTFGYKVLDVISNAIPFAAELGLTAGAYTLGKKGATEGLKFLLTKTGKEATEEALQKFGYKVTKGVAGATVQSVATAPIKVTRDTLERQLTSNLTYEDINEKESVIKSIGKSFIDNWVEVVSERSGEAIGIVFNKISAPVKDKLLKNALFSSLAKLNPGKSPVIENIFKTVGYNGVINEMAEERVGELTRGLLNKVGLSDEEFKLPSKDQLLVELVSFSVPGLTGIAASKGISLGENVVKLNPDAARETVEMSDLKGTEAGDKIIKAADDAEAQGTQVLVDLDGVNGEITQTPEQNKIGISIDKANIQKEKVVEMKEKLIEKVSVGTEGETVKKKLEIKPLTESEITKFKEVALRSPTAKSFINRIGIEGYKRLKESGQKGVEFYNEVHGAKQIIYRSEKGMDKENVRLAGGTATSYAITKELASQYGDVKEFQLISKPNLIDISKLQPENQGGIIPYKIWKKIEISGGARGIEMEKFLKSKGFDGYQSGEEIVLINKNIVKESKKPQIKELKKASIPVMITRDMKQQLFDRGYTKDQVSKMNPTEANKILTGDTKTEEQKALGAYREGMIKILDGQGDAVNTYLHESVHKYFDLFLTENEQVELLIEAKKQFGGKDFAEVEENLAENLIKYVNKKEIENAKIKTIFDKFIDRIKKYFKNEDKISSFYEEIISGKAKKKIKKQKTQPLKKFGPPTTDFKKEVPPIKQTKREDAIKKPVEETPGKPKLSRVAERVLEKLQNVKTADVTYNPMSIVEDAAKASEFVVQNPEIALRIAKGLELPPPDITETSISIAMAEQAKQNGDWLLYSRLVVSRSLRQTRRGQEIVAERGRMDENSDEFFIRKLLDERARIVTRGKKWIFGKEVGIQSEIKKQTTQLKQNIDKKVLNKLQSAQKLIDSLTCKI